MEKNQLEGRRRRERQPMYCKWTVHQTMRNLDITTEDAQDRNRLGTVMNGKRNLLCIWLEKKPL